MHSIFFDVYLIDGLPWIWKCLCTTCCIVLCSVLCCHGPDSFLSCALRLSLYLCIDFLMAWSIAFHAADRSRYRWFQYDFEPAVEARLWGIFYTCTDKHVQLFARFELAHSEWGISSIGRWCALLRSSDYCYGNCLQRFRSAIILIKILCMKNARSSLFCKSISSSFDTIILMNFSRSSCVLILHQKWSSSVVYTQNHPLSKKNNAKL